ncbi:MAG: glycerophosphoryl diester phosphodiesterase membrane domain-containing protein [Clostridiales bacterium]|nr:glycerophosphoryl diester phosphodiesterase membrane domain-containing protein [Clostridiales bacterium]
MSDPKSTDSFPGKIRSTVNKFFQGFLSFLKNVWILFKQNFKEVMIFILFCSTFTTIATSLLKEVLIKGMMKVSGVTYIVPANLKSVLLNPLSILMIIVFSVIITFFSLFEIAGLLHAFSMAQVGRGTNLTSMFMAGLRACRKASHPKNWLLIVFILVLFPLTKLLPLSTSTFKIILPGFVNQTIDYTKSLSIMYSVIYFVLISFLTIYIFSINCFVMQKTSFIKSCAESRRLGKGHFIETFLTLFLLTILLNFAINSVSSIVVVNCNEVVSFIKKNSANVVLKSEDVGTYTYVLRQILKSFISPAVNNAALAVLFYRQIDAKDMLKSLSSDTFKSSKASKKMVITFITVMAVLFAAAGIFLIHRYSYLIEEVDKPLVCAHRGDNINAPENTMEAFELAASESLEWIELDVHQTSDGVIVCNHDSTIQRVSGQNLAIREHTFEELKKCEYGSWMPGNYEHVTIPTLEEVLVFAKENELNVQVELKGHSDDINFEENVIRIINDTGMHDNVMIISQDASRMKRVMEIDPTITKGYCVFLALGHPEDIEYTDNISVEETNVTPELVRHLHAQGKKVFCWTVDLDDTVQYLVSCDVDVIGTDNPMLISNAVEKADCSGGISRAFHIFMRIIADMDK